MGPESFRIEPNFATEFQDRGNGQQPHRDTFATSAIDSFIVFGLCNLVFL